MEMIDQGFVRRQVDRVKFIATTAELNARSEHSTDLLARLRTQLRETVSEIEQEALSLTSVERAAAHLAAVSGHLKVLATAAGNDTEREFLTEAVTLVEATAKNPQHDPGKLLASNEILEDFRNPPLPSDVKIKV